MKKTARIAIFSLAFAISALANAQSKPKYTTVVISYVGPTDRPVFPVVISCSADEAEWYKQKLFIDPVSTFAHEYIVRESTMKKIANLLSPNGGKERFERRDEPRTSRALTLVIAKGRDSQEITLEVDESLTYVSRLKKQISKYSPLANELSGMQGMMNQQILESHR